MGQWILSLCSTGLTIVGLVVCHVFDRAHAMTIVSLSYCALRDQYPNISAALCILSATVTPNGQFVSQMPHCTQSEAWCARRA